MQQHGAPLLPPTLKKLAAISNKTGVQLLPQVCLGLEISSAVTGDSGRVSVCSYS